MNLKKKKILSFLMALIVALSIIPASFGASAAQSDTVVIGGMDDDPSAGPDDEEQFRKIEVENEYGTFGYTISYGKAALSWYKGSAETVEIPSAVEGCPVTEVGGFSRNTSVKTVVIPDSVTAISYAAFHNCTNLAQITIPDSLTAIDSYAFEGTKWFDNQTGDAVYAGKILYKAKGNPSQVTVKDGTTQINQRAFADCTNLQTVDIPTSVTSIGELAFYFCAGLKEIVIPDGVTTIEWETFYGCTDLTSVTLPASLKRIGIEAFYQCVSLETVEFPAAMETIGDSAFRNCIGLSSVSFSDAVTEIGSYAFNGCSLIKSVTIPASVTKIGYLAFGEEDEMESTVDVTVYGYYHTAAEQFAAQYDCVFIPLAPAVENKMVQVDVPAGVTYTVTEADTVALTQRYRAMAAEMMIDDEVFPADSTMYQAYTIILYGEDNHCYLPDFDDTVTVRIRCKQPGARVIDGTGYLEGEPQAVNEDGWLVFDSRFSSKTFSVVVDGDVAIAVNGDADGDGAVSSDDVAMVQRRLAGIKTSVSGEIMAPADVDDDCEVTVIDATWIQRDIAKMQTPYPIGEKLM